MSIQTTTDQPLSRTLVPLLAGIALGAIFVTLSNARMRQETREKVRALANRLMGKDGKLDSSDEELIEALFI